ncbi:MAG: DUF6379 domain-containing protein [Clostridiales bacterium]|nr:DUF6379 domain-containing protein [Clostridiales bacterium]
MDFQAYNNILICKENIKNTVVDDVKVGYEFKIKYPSYRGAFLSCIEELRFQMDGVDIPKPQISFHVNGKDFLIDELPECFKEYWFVRDPATIRVRQSGGIASGEHAVHVYMKHRVPYTGYFGQYLELISDRTAILMAE